MQIKEFITWENVFDIIDDFTPKFALRNYTDIVAIARGGLMPAQLLAHRLKIRRVHSLGISFYEKDFPEGKRKVPQTYQLLTSNLSDSKILLVDEIADSGATFTHALKYLKIVNPEAVVETFAMYYKPCSVYKPDYIAAEVESERWLVFPYES
jgi:uncharacterized protein